VRREAPPQLDARGERVGARGGGGGEGGEALGHLAVLGGSDRVPHLLGLGGGEGEGVRTAGEREARRGRKGRGEEASAE